MTIRRKNNMAELLNCPMCDSEAHVSKGYAIESVWPHGEFHRVYCGSCQLRQLFHRTEAEAISAWNRRASPAQAEPTPIYQRYSRHTEQWKDVSKCEYDHILNTYGKEYVRIVCALPPEAKDAQRVDWLQKQAGISLHEPVTMPNTISEYKTWLLSDAFGDEIGKGATLREAIDAAMLREEGVKG
jgi:hypothetical protein